MIIFVDLEIIYGLACSKFRRRQSAPGNLSSCFEGHSDFLQFPLTYPWWCNSNETSYASLDAI
jgi:hypothetical protein